MLADDGVGVTLVSPGRVRTDFWAKLGTPDLPDLDARDVADVIVFALDRPAGSTWAR